MTRLLIAALGMTALVALAPAAPVPREADKPPLYFTTRVGDTRVWAWVGDKNEFTEVVTEVESKNGTKFITVESTSGTDFRAVKKYVLSEEGLFRLSYNAHRYDKPWCILKAPYRTDDHWAVDVVDHFGVRCKVKHTIGRLEWVEVPAGKFRALRVETESDEQKPPRTATSWHANGVGEVMSVRRSASGMEDGRIVLKFFKPGKD